MKGGRWQVAGTTTLLHPLRRGDAEQAETAGERELPEPYGDGKRTLVERFCQERHLLAQDCFAYTDHHSDASLLEFVGHPVAANPTPKLQAIAVARGWPQINLEVDELPPFRLRREDD